MKRIIFLLTCIVFFTNQGKAFIVSHTVVSKSGHKYAFYKCGKASLNYNLEARVCWQNDNYYSYASVTAYFSDNTSKGIQLWGGQKMLLRRGIFITIPEVLLLPKVKL